MKKLILIITLLVLPVPAFAMTDYACVNDCTSKGYMYQYCTEKCSYGTDAVQPPPLIQIPRYDFLCISNCQAKGYMYMYCQQVCKY